MVCRHAATAKGIREAAKAGCLPLLGLLERGKRLRASGHLLHALGLEPPPANGLRKLHAWRQQIDDDQRCVVLQATLQFIHSCSAPAVSAELPECMHVQAASTCSAGTP